MENQIAPSKQFNHERLTVKVYNNRIELGMAAGKAVASQIKRLLEIQDKVTMVFAAAPSQNEFLQTLATQAGIDWGRVVALHMDEYVGLPAGAPQSFGRYLAEHLFDLVNPGEVHYINGNAASVAAECQRYSRLIIENPIDIVCGGIGENGHLAFNDPPVANFLDPEIIKVVALEAACREQQVHDGCFPSIDQVPTLAITLTIPAFMSARYIYCMVPGPTKAKAVKSALSNGVATSCPASILRRHYRACLFLDQESAALL